MLVPGRVFLFSPFPLSCCFFSFRYRKFPKETSSCDNLFFRSIIFGTCLPCAFFPLNPFPPPFPGAEWMEIGKCFFSFWFGGWVGDGIPTNRFHAEVSPFLRCKPRPPPCKLGVFARLRPKLCVPVPPPQKDFFPQYLCLIITIPRLLRE